MHLLYGEDLKYKRHQMLAGIWSNVNFHSLLVGMQNSATTLKDILAVLFTKLNILLPYDPAIAFLGICAKEL